MTIATNPTAENITVAKYYFLQNMIKKCLCKTILMVVGPCQ